MISQFQLQPRRMTPQLARQKALDLSYEIGALNKIKERLERQRETLLMYCDNT
jgi:histone deacetylase complex regulatory component SIN3